MNKGKILKMPTKILEQKENKSELFVNCEQTYRWLRFSKVFSDSENRKVALIDVMTTNVDGIDKKICRLAISIDELNKVIKKIQQDKD